MNALRLLVIAGMGTVAASPANDELKLGMVVALGLALGLLEIILAADNIIIIASECSDVVPERRDWAIRGAIIQGALIRGIAILLLSQLHRFEDPFFEISDPVALSLSPIGVVMLIGAGFLVFSVSKHLWEGVEDVSFRAVLDATGLSEKVEHEIRKKELTSRWVRKVLSLSPINLAFGIDSVLFVTAMTHSLGAIYIAIGLQVLVMIFAAGPISRFFEKRKIFKLAALSFVGLVAAFLFAESLGHALPKYLLWCMGVFGMALGWYFQLRHDRGAKDLVAELKRRLVALRDADLTVEVPNRVVDQIRE